jgi:Cytochrome P450
MLTFTVGFDVVGEFTLSTRLGFLEQGHDIDNMLHDLNTEFSYRGWVQNMPVLDQWLKKNPIYAYFKSPTNTFILKARSLIQARLSQEKTTGARPDFMDRFLEAQKLHPGVVTNQILAGYVSTNFFAGSDTTAVVMRSILYYTIRTPGVLEKLRHELDNSGTAYPVPYKTAQHLPYLDALIREAMRIHFIGSILFERVVPSSGYTLPNGTQLPAGTIIGMNPWTLNFDEEIWGADTESFKPERWLQAPGEEKEVFEKRLAVMKHNDFSFSYGPRVCLGRHIATLEIYKVMPTLLGLLDVSFLSLPILVTSFCANWCRWSLLIRRRNGGFMDLSSRDSLIWM